MSIWLYQSNPIRCNPILSNACKSLKQVSRVLGAKRTKPKFIERHSKNIYTVCKVYNINNKIRDYSSSQSEKQKKNELLGKVLKNKNKKKNEKKNKKIKNENIPCSGSRTVFAEKRIIPFPGSTAPINMWVNSRVNIVTVGSWGSVIPNYFFDPVTACYWDRYSSNVLARG